MEEENEEDDGILGANRTAAASRVMIHPFVFPPLAYRLFERFIVDNKPPLPGLNLVLTPAF